MSAEVVSGLRQRQVDETEAQEAPALRLGTRARPVGRGLEGLSNDLQAVVFAFLHAADLASM
jgi:hypothetical protein